MPDKMMGKNRCLMMTLCLIQLTSCGRGNNSFPQATTFPVAGGNAIQLIDYGDPGLQQLKYKLSHSDREKIHILQLGDSHTASDFFPGSCVVILNSSMETAASVLLVLWQYLATALITSCSQPPKAGT